MKKQILFVNDEMTLGGVSRILNNLLHMLDKDKYDVDLLILHPHGELMDEIPNWVRVIPSDKFFFYVDVDIKSLIKAKDIVGITKKTLFFLLMKSPFIKTMIVNKRKALFDKQYDVEFAAKEGFCTIFTAFGDSKNKLNWVQTDYRENNYAKRHMKLLKKALLMINMNIACSDQVASSFMDVFEISNFTVIHNLINEKHIKKLSEVMIPPLDEKKINLISVARFHPQKGLDRLIEAVKYVVDHGIDVNLELIGDGILKEKLQSQVLQLNLNEKVQFLGYQTNPYPYIRRNDLFVLSSLYEGYPTIVIESLISTTPVLALDVAGVKDQITENEHGVITKNDQKSLNSTLLDLCKDKQKLIRNKQMLADYHYDNQRILNDICYYIDNKV